MALSSVKDGKYLSLTHDASTAWTWQDTSHGWGDVAFVKLSRILWVPNAADDVICVKNFSTSGPIIFYAKAADAYDQRIVYFYGEKVRPVIDQSVTTGANQVIHFSVE